MCVCVMCVLLLVIVVKTAVDGEGILVEGIKLVENAVEVLLLQLLLLLSLARLVAVVIGGRLLLEEAEEGLGARLLGTGLPHNRLDRGSVSELVNLAADLSGVSDDVGTELDGNLAVKFVALGAAGDVEGGDGTGELGVGGGVEEGEVVSAGEFVTESGSPESLSVVKKGLTLVKEDLDLGAGLDLDLDLLGASLGVVHGKLAGNDAHSLAELLSGHIDDLETSR